MHLIALRGRWVVLTASGSKNPEALWATCNLTGGHVHSAQAPGAKA